MLVVHFMKSNLPSCSESQPLSRKAKFYTRRVKMRRKRIRSIYNGVFNENRRSFHQKHSIKCFENTFFFFKINDDPLINKAAKIINEEAFARVYNSGL